MNISKALTLMSCELASNYTRASQTAQTDVVLITYLDLEADVLRNTRNIPSEFLAQTSGVVACMCYLHDYTNEEIRESL
jgi:hypothetical protein